MLTEQVFHFLYLYFDASAAYHIVLPALDAEEDGALSFVIKGDLELKVYVGGENDEQND